MLLIIGLDGASWRILDPWLRTGELPNLAALRDAGRWGVLESTIRPESSVAWATFATGVDPGKHAIFGFSAQSPDSYTTSLNTASSIRVPSWWARAARQGRRVALLNIPMTYPPSPSPGGAVIAGMLTPSLNSQFTQPPSLRQELLAAVPDYLINVDHTGMDLRAFIHATTHAIRARGRAAVWLCQRQPWDAMAVVFTDTDRLQHYTLHLLAPDHPNHDTGKAAALVPDLLEAYQALDQAIGDLLSCTPPGTTVLVLSDHGFTPCARRFHVNNWLVEQGYLSLLAGRNPIPAPPTGLRRFQTLRRIKRALPGLRDLRIAPRPDDHFRAIDWSRTSVVYSPAGGLRFNLAGREPEGTLSEGQAQHLASEITRKLYALRDPDSGEKPIRHIYPREDLYTGPYVHLAPDLILEPERDHVSITANTALPYRFGAQALVPSQELTGNHSLDGLFLAVGPGIDQGPLDGAHLRDMAPTILHKLSLPVPRSLDGEVLPLWPQGDQVRWQEEDLEALGDRWHPDAAVYDAAEQAAIEERLRSLGYL